MKKLHIVIESDADAERARRFAEQYQMPISSPPALTEQDVAIVFAAEGVSLEACEGRQSIRISADFVTGAAAHRRRFGGGKGQALAKAVGLHRKFAPRVIDATAGLGRDAFVLATHGAEVTMVERSPVVRLLLEDACIRAQAHAVECGDKVLQSILARMQLASGDSRDFLDQSETSADVVYLDPMFPQRTKSALVKKEMRIFHQLVGADEDADALLDAALRKAIYRVVVKRPRLAPFLAGRAPSYQLCGKTSRFDIYARKSLP